jgi:hypothetical protein
MDIEDAQREMRSAFLGGFAGQRAARQSRFSRKRM